MPQKISRRNQSLKKTKESVVFASCKKTSSKFSLWVSITFRFAGLKQSKELWKHIVANDSQVEVLGINTYSH